MTSPAFFISFVNVYTKYGIPVYTDRPHGLLVVHNTTIVIEINNVGMVEPLIDIHYKLYTACRTFTYN